MKINEVEIYISIERTIKIKIKIKKEINIFTQFFYKFKSVIKGIMHLEF